MRRPDGPRVRIDGRRLGHKASAVIRRLATGMVARGERPSDVMARFGLCRTTIYRWLKTVREQGAGGLAMKTHPGRRPRVGPEEARRLRAWIVGRAPPQHGLSGRMWTRRTASLLVRKSFGVALSAVATGRMLDRLGLRPPLPEPWSPETGPVEGLLFAVDGRGAFLCARLPAASAPGGLPAVVRALQRASGRPVRLALAPARAL